MPVQILAKISAILHKNSTAFSVPPDQYRDSISNGPRPLPSEFFLLHDLPIILYLFLLNSFYSMIYQSFYTSSFLILSTPRFNNHFIISTTQYKILSSSYNEQVSYQNHLTEGELLSMSYQMFLNMFTYSLISHLFIHIPAVLQKSKHTSSY
jgi:hypothetical protein